MYLVNGSDSTWRSFRLDGSFTVTEVSTVVLPADLRSAAVGGGTYVGLPTGRFFAMVDIDTTPTTVSVFLNYTALPTSSDFFTAYEWVDSSTQLTNLGSSVGNAVHVLPSTKAPGGERVFTYGELDIVITNKAPVVDGQRIFFKVYGDTGPNDKIIRFYYSTQGEPPVSQATLTGTASGGVAVMNGNQVENVNADGVTTYEATWDFAADSIATGTRVQIVPRIILP
jgi:hypothetical protein